MSLGNKVLPLNLAALEGGIGVRDKEVEEDEQRDVAVTIASCEDGAVEEKLHDQDQDHDQLHDHDHEHDHDHVQESTAGRGDDPGHASGPGQAGEEEVDQILADENRGVLDDFEKLLLEGYSQVTDEDRAVLHKVMLRIKERLEGLPPEIASFLIRVGYREMQAVLYEDDGRFRHLMTAFGKKLKDVGNSVASKVASRKAAATRAAAVAGAAEAVVKGAADLMLTGLGAAAGLAAGNVPTLGVGEQQQQQQHEQQQHQQGAQGGEQRKRRRVSIAQASAAAAALDEEKAKELEELVGMLEARWLIQIDNWEKTRAPIREKIVHHEEEQKRKAAEVSQGMWNNASAARWIELSAVDRSLDRSLLFPLSPSPPVLLLPPPRPRPLLNSQQNKYKRQTTTHHRTQTTCTRTCQRSRSSCASFP